jgi:hypothetical protein
MRRLTHTLPYGTAGPKNAVTVNLYDPDQGPGCMQCDDFDKGTNRRCVPKP